MSAADRVNLEQSTVLLIDDNPQALDMLSPVFQGFGVKEQIIFPEIEYDKIDALRGMNISVTTTAKTDDEARALLGAFKFPFKN